jgi:3D (Asp-Asp-Asp) domain-containing protein
MAQGARQPAQSQVPQKLVLTVESIEGVRSFSVEEGITIGDAIAQKGIRLSGKDFLTGSPTNAPIESNQTVVLHHITEGTLTEEEPISFSNRYVPAYDLPLGERRTEIPGVLGMKRITYQCTYVDGQVKQKDRIGETLVREPVPAVVGLGVEVMSADAAMRASQAYPHPSGEATFEMEGTAYSPLVEETDGDPWSTSVGLRSGYGIVAVDPAVIPYYTPLYIDGYGYAVAGDTGGAIRGKCIDVFFYSYAETNAFGRRPVKVWVLP